jgi:hypothetical protein
MGSRGEFQEGVRWGVGSDCRDGVGYTAWLWALEGREELGLCWPHKDWQ